jgi:uncharacterized membrane protein
VAKTKDASLPPSAKRNIETIAQVEQALLRKRTFIERIGERVAHFFGSLLFIAAHVFLISFWIMINTGTFVRIAPFDPFPFSFLSLIVGIEFIFLTTCVLLNQKYQIRREEQWAHLHLQLSILTEQEATKIMQMLSTISRKLGIHDALTDAELSELAKPTSVKAFVGEIEKSRDSGLAPDETVTEMEKEADKTSRGKLNKS